MPRPPSDSMLRRVVGAAALAFGQAAFAGATLIGHPDLDRDGRVGAFELATVLAHWGPAASGDPLRRVDVDEDGTVGATDMAAVLAGWGVAPAWPTFGPRRLPMRSPGITFPTDVDGDGCIDLLVDCEDGLRLIRNLGFTDGADAIGVRGPTLDPFSEPLLPPGEFHAVGDFDGDGLVEIAHAGPGAGYLQLHEIPASGDVVTTGLVILPGGLVRVVAVDIDLDGDDDLVVVTTGAKFHVLRNDAGVFVGDTTGDPGYWTTGLIVGDVDGDGLPDLALPAINPPRIEVFLGAARQAGTWPKEGTIDTEYYPIAVALGDLDDDGRDEIVFGTFGAYSVGTIAWSLVGPGAFTPTQFPSPGWFSMIATDIDGDGMDDLVGIGDAPTSGPDSDQLRVMRRTGQYAFETSHHSTGPSPELPVIVDLDGDGDHDAIVPASSLDAILVFTSSGDGTFDTPVWLDEPGGGPHLGASGVVIAADHVAGASIVHRLDYGHVLSTLVNGVLTAVEPLDSASVVFGSIDLDSTTDLLLSVTGGVEFRAGDGVGGFGPPLFSSPQGTALVPIVADLDADGRADLVWIKSLNGVPGAPSFPTIIRSATGVGDGTFAAARDLAQLTGANAIRAADLDADGDLDAVVATTTPSSTYVIINK